MRLYAAALTGIVAGWATAVLLVFTPVGFFGSAFLCILAALLAVIVFALVTEPRKRKETFWESGGGLDVMVQRRTKR